MVIHRVIDEFLNTRWYLQQVTGRIKDLEQNHNLADWQCFKLLEGSKTLLEQSQLPERARKPACLAVILNDMLTGLWRDPQVLDTRKKQELYDLCKLLCAKNEGGHPKTLPMDEASHHVWHADLLQSQLSSLEAPIRKVLEEGVVRTAGMILRQLDRAKVRTISDYNLHCHALNGVLQITLAQIFAACGTEGSYLGNGEHLSNALGLVNAKTHEILNFRTHAKLGMASWPRDIWGLYSVDDVGDFLRPGKERAFEYCLNTMILDALQHVPDVYCFLSRIDDPAVFRLFALEQVINITTLCRMYGGASLGMLPTVQMGEGETMSLHRQLMGLSDFQRVLQDELRGVRDKLGPSDPISDPMALFLGRMETLCCRTRNKSFVLTPWELTWGTVIELCIVAVIGLILAVTSSHLYRIL